MTFEAVVAITAGVTAGSLVLTAFGLDSVIELASAGVLMWRLSVELRHGQKFSESAERTASRIGGALLFLLAAYVTAAALWQLWRGTGEEFSWPGFVVALVAIPAMRYLAYRKIAIAEKIRNLLTAGVALRIHHILCPHARARGGRAGRPSRSGRGCAEQSDRPEPPGRRSGCWLTSPFLFSGIVVRRFWFGAIDDDDDDVGGRR